MASPESVSSREPPGDDQSVDVDALVAELREKVERRRLEGSYPPDLEETLAQHFERLVGGRAMASPAVYDELDRALSELENFEYGRGRIGVDSSIPGGRLVHRAVGKVISRQVQGVLEQAQDHAHSVSRSFRLVSELARAVGQEFDGKVLQQLEDLQVKVAEQQREINALRQALSDVTQRIPGIPAEAFYGQDRFTAAFRGSADQIRNRYRSLAERLEGCAPVVDLGFGRGELLELLGELGVECYGVEVDGELLARARGRGLDVREGRAVEHLASLPDGGLGGIAMIQVIEHLAPQQVIDVVKLAADKLRSGGRLVIETVNPESLYVYARAFWIDPDHVKPVHPAFLEFLCREAGFARIERTERSPVPEDEGLVPLPGDDDVSTQVNVNLERIGAVVFGPQDYAIIATR